MVLYSLTKFGIIKPSTNIPWLRGLDLAFWKSSKQIYRELQYTQKAFREFQDLPCFPRKWFCIHPQKFEIIKTWTNILWLRRFDLGFSQTLKEIYWKIQYTEKFFGKFQLSQNKMVLCWWSKLYIFEPFANVQSHRRFDLGFW